MYALPKGLESAWVALRGRGLVLHAGKYGNPLVSKLVNCWFLLPRAAALPCMMQQLTAFAMGMVMVCGSIVSGFSLLFNLG